MSSQAPRPAGFCSAALTSEGCRRQGCTKVHHVYRCLCGTALLIANRVQHEAGKRHKELMKACSTARPAPNRASNSANNRFSEFTNTVRCEECERDVPATEAAGHAASHASNVSPPPSSASSEDEDEPTTDDRVVVSNAEGLDFELVDPKDLRKILAINIWKTQCPNVIKLKRVGLNSASQGAGSVFRISAEAQNRVLSHHSPLSIPITCIPNQLGCYDDEIEFTFADLTEHETFTVSRQLLVNIGSRRDHELLASSRGPVKKRKIRHAYRGPLNFQLRPPVWTETVWKTRLPEAPTPKRILDALGNPEERRQDPQNAQNAIREMTGGELTIKNYESSERTLLYVEEEEQRVELEALSLTDVIITAKHPRYRLEVTGMIDKDRPSLLVGDFILVRRVEAQKGDKWIQGCIHSIHHALTYIEVRFDDKFSLYNSTKYDVRFVLNRLPFRRAHGALMEKALTSQRRVLFPEAKDIRGKNVNHEKMEEMKGKLSNPLIAGDTEQLAAVTRIVYSPPGNVPFVIYGPPGTGKTTTLVEAILQLVRRDPDVRILACAPNNRAADSIARGLRSLWDENAREHDLLRLNAFSRPSDTNWDPKGLPLDLKDISIVNGNNFVAMPKLEELLKYRVVISTCVSSGVPSGLGVPKGHFSHIFVDEAGNATEPESLIGMLTLGNTKTNLILAGDPKQLGPVVKSTIARQLGLKLSYMERLLGRPVYSQDEDETGGRSGGWRGVTVVKLLESYRSHPAIMAFSNTMFYGSQLRLTAPSEETHSLEDADVLPRKKFPIVFHSIVGKAEREGASRSWFNINEATEVRKYCERLVFTKANKIDARDIIVITPYHTQAIKIQSLLWQDHRLVDVRVGSVEEFQGQESKVVIMSTVRSKDPSAPRGGTVRGDLGFVADPKRLNVAITRAKALLIVVGNPQMLCKDEFWHAFILYVKAGGGLKGQMSGRVWGEGLDDASEEEAEGSVDGTQREGREIPGDVADMMARVKAKLFKETDIDV